MPSPLGELTTQAQHLITSGDLAAAQELLADALSDADPRPGNATCELAEAAGLHARVLVTLGEPHPARGWAAFAYAAMTRLYGRPDQRTIAAAATLAAVLYRVGSHVRAARLYQEVIIELTAIDGPESLRVLAAHADLATVEYARGECTVARERLKDAWELHREVYGDGHVSGIKMLARLGAMQRDCGQFAEAHENLALARELCRNHLDPDDPLATQVAALARAAANPDHRCDDVAEAPEVTDPTAGASWEDRFPESEPHEDPAPGPPTDTTGPASAGQDEHWWPPEVDRSDERPGPRHSTEAPLPPSVVGFTGGRQREHAGVHRVGQALAPAPAPRLPVPVPRPPARHRRRLTPLVVAGVVVVLLGAGAVIAGVAQVDEPADEPQTPAPSGSATAAREEILPPRASPGTPPGRVALRDDRDSIALTWAYPAGAAGPVVVSGAPSGQDPRTIKELPAGSSSYVASGLDGGIDYCFVVAVVYSARTVGRAEPVCTERD